VIGSLGSTLAVWKRKSGSQAAVQGVLYVEITEVDLFMQLILTSSSIVRELSDSTRYCLR
jgi:hypothetical protein